MHMNATAKYTKCVACMEKRFDLPTFLFLKFMK